MVLGLNAAPVRAAHLAHTDANGRVLALSLDGDLIPVVTDLRLHQPGWTGVATLGPWSAELTSFAETNGERTWTGRIPVGLAACRYAQTLTESNGAARLHITVTAETDVDLEALHFALSVPIRDFAGGKVQIRGGPAALAAAFPKALPDDEHFLAGLGTEAVLASAAGDHTLSVTFDQPVGITFQDERRWNYADYGLFVPCARGRMRAGQTVEIAVTLRMTGRADHAAARLTVDPGQRLFRFDGFGGNYCFALDSPIADYTLAEVRSHWARTEMKLRLWAPGSIAADAAAAWQACATNDVAGSDLRRGMLVAQALRQRGVPTMISLWRLPEWLYAWPAAAGTSGQRQVAADRWPQLLAAIGSYLLYAREHYGVEPDLFSFNESEIGVDVMFTAAEHAAMVQRLGAHLEGLGLKTRMVAGDTGSARGAAPEFAAAPLKDAAARR